MTAAPALAPSPRATGASYTEVPLERGAAGEAGTELALVDDGALLRRSVLPGGVRVITESVPGLRSTSMGMWFGVGSRDEVAGQEGSTHFLEHLLFKGTPTRDARAIAEAFDMIGGESNAATSKEHTSYYARVQGQDSMEALDVITDMVTSSLLDPKEVETERTVIVSELADAADDPQDVAHEAFARAAFGEGTPLGRPIGGTPETVTAVPRDAVWEHYQRTYASDTLVVAVAGAVDHEQVCERVAQDLAAAGWDASASAAPRERRFETEPLTALDVQDVTIERDSEQSHVYLACQGIAVRDERRWPMSVLTTILGGGMSSRLFQEVREKRGLAYSTYAFDASYAGAGAFGLYAGCAPGDVEEVCAVMVGEFEALAANGPTEREMARARGQIGGAMVLGGEDSLARMGRLGRGEVVTGRLRSMDENLRQLEAVTAEQVRELCAWLAGHARARVLVGPRA
ncbi:MULTISPECIES: pitrilysin family protein [unclassified Actinomyces]|uniref:M16 family metallopeptidase n=1 Tax=unclassified Actinomyces TaxID=2609248 RepID=UPI002017B9A8|nr:MULTISPECIES: pitrilysin family protein [unclassified Actinomyces]MCL3778696.1 insulinase family protein [Actinomyces sp. AC-20-1]MCL3790708.1 insulinase family protein [Actinomyces sp. 187325]MCL3793017.1 insulinase family protein [Actinomyces sp. 186855]MCL3795454.1 insulinase family protein [Actinomyces sp. 217892]